MQQHSSPRKLLSRRCVLRKAGASALALVTAPSIGKVTAGPPKATLRETRVVSLRPHHYHGWPTVVRRKNGELLLVCSGGREAHVCPFGQVEVMRSNDGGAVWPSPKGNFANFLSAMSSVKYASTTFGCGS